MWRAADVMHNGFFDFTVNRAHTCDTYEGYTPEQGNQLLVAELSIKNTFSETIPMFDTDIHSVERSGGPGQRVCQSRRERGPAGGGVRTGGGRGADRPFDF